jgi:hypothetical protein
LLHLPRVVSATEVQLIARNGAQLGLLTMVRAQLDQVNLSVKAQGFYYDNEITRTPGPTAFELNARHESLGATVVSDPALGEFFARESLFFVPRSQAEYTPAEAGRLKPSDSTSCSYNTVGPCNLPCKNWIACSDSWDDEGGGSWSSGSERVCTCPAVQCETGCNDLVAKRKTCVEPGTCNSASWYVGCQQTC